MVQLKKLSFTYNVPWETVLLAFENKFWEVPSPDMPDVLGVDYTDFCLSEDGSVTTFQRRAEFAMRIPAWLMKMAGGPTSVVFYSDTTIDRKKRELKAVGRNETFRSRVEMDEVTMLVPDPKDPEHKCILSMDGRLSILIMLLGFGSTVERIIMNQYESMTNEARKIERKKVTALQAQLEASGKPAGFTRSELKAREVAAAEAAKDSTGTATTADAASGAAPAVAGGGAGGGAGAIAGAGDGAAQAGAGASAAAADGSGSCSGGGTDASAGAATETGGTAAAAATTATSTAVAGDADAGSSSTTEPGTAGSASVAAAPPQPPSSAATTTTATTATATATATTAAKPPAPPTASTANGLDATAATQTPDLSAAEHVGGAI